MSASQGNPKAIIFTKIDKFPIKWKRMPLGWRGTIKGDGWEHSVTRDTKDEVAEDLATIDHEFQNYTEADVIYERM